MPGTQIRQLLMKCHIWRAASATLKPLRVWISAIPSAPDRLKEDLVLKHAEAVKSFTWRYAPGELRARQDGADVVFEDAEGMEAYRLSAPYMEDAAGSISRGLTLTLTDDGGKKNKEAYVRLEADGEWLGAEDRVYPVTIDPVVSTPVDRDKIRDCHVSSYYHGDNF